MYELYLLICMHCNESVSMNTFDPNVLCFYFFFFSSRRRHTRCALVTGVQTCALPICCWSTGNCPISAAWTLSAGCAAIWVTPYPSCWLPIEHWKKRDRKSVV